MAVAFAGRGFAVFPLAPKSKIPLIAGGRGCLDATKDVEQIEKWWGDAPSANIGIACGPESGIFVIDVDTYKGASFDDLLSAAGMSETTEIVTRVVRTARGGQHFYFKYPLGGIGCKNDILPGIDIKGAGGYVVSNDSFVVDEKTGLSGWYKLESDNPIQDCPC